MGLGLIRSTPDWTYREKTFENEILKLWVVARYELIPLRIRLELDFQGILSSTTHGFWVLQLKCLYSIIVTVIPQIIQNCLLNDCFRKDKTDGNEPAALLVTCFDVVEFLIAINLMINLCQLLLLSFTKHINLLKRNTPVTKGCLKNQ